MQNAAFGTRDEMALFVNIAFIYVADPYATLATGK